MRFFFTLLVVFGLSTPAEAQQSKKIFRIGYLANTSGGESSLRQGLRELGYVEGKNITIEDRDAEGNFDRFPALAAELVRLKVDVIVTASTPAAVAAKKRSSHSQRTKAGRRADTAQYGLEGTTKVRTNL
jgi:putative tryptophan/tyrosine transport system substrate-binding protein